jgi:hypothetical protein
LPPSGIFEVKPTIVQELSVLQGSKIDQNVLNRGDPATEPKLTPSLIISTAAEAADAVGLEAIIIFQDQAISSPLEVFRFTACQADSNP